MAEIALANQDVEVVEDEEDEVEIPEDELPPEKQTIEYDIEAPNMVPSLMASPGGKKAVKEIADAIYREVEDAQEALAPYRARSAKDWKIFSGMLPPKDMPFEGCANAHIPSFMEDASRLYMRMYTELFGDFSEVFSYDPVGPDDQDIAEAISRHSNWQLKWECTDFPAQMERAALFFIMPGDVTCHSFYDTARKKIRHEILTPDDFVVPYVQSATEIDYSDCPWIAKWLRLFKHQMQRMRQDWHDVDTVIDARKPSMDDEPDDSPMADAQKEYHGNDPGDEQRAPYKLVHYEGWIDLPQEPDERFCKVVMDWNTRHVLQIQLLEEADWKDAARFDQQSGDAEQYRTARTQHGEMEQQALQEGQVAMQLGMPAPELPPPPQAPAWAENPDELMDPAWTPEPPRRVPIHMFTHGKGIEAPSGPLGIGVGRVLSDLNVAANVVFSQYIDSATLANCYTWLMGGGSQLKEPIRIRPGFINPIPGVGSKDIKDILIPLQAAPANPQMIDMVRLFRELSEAASQAPSVLSGDPGKSGETYRGIQTRVEQATKQISFITGKFARFVANIAKNHGRLNAQFMPENEIVFVNNHKLGTLAELSVGRGMYDRDYRVSISSDLRFSSQAARVTEADQVYQLVTAGWPPTLPPNPALIQAALKDVLLARAKDHLVKFLGPEMPPPMTPMGLPPPPPPMAPGMPPPPPGDPNAPPPPQGAPQPPSAPPDGVPPQ